MTALLLGIAGLLVGPVIAEVLKDRRSAFHLFDGLSLVAVTGLILLHLVPEALAAAGPLVLLTCAFGFVLPHLAESTLRLPHGRVHRAVLVLAILGVGFHAALDGAALHGLQGVLRGGGAAGAHAEPDAGRDHAHDHDHDHAHDHGHASGEERSDALLLAVLVHRLPFGLLLWILVRGRYGVGPAAATIAGMCVATVVGYAGASALLAHLTGAGGAHLLMLMSGSLLHVVLGHGEIGHEPHHEEGDACAANAGVIAIDALERRTAPRWSGAGALIGVLFLLFASHAGALGARFVGLYLESAGALLIGFLAAGLVSQFLPRGSVAWVRSGGTLAQATKGVAIGLPLPVCSCGVVPLYRSLVQRGAPPAAALAFLVATPELGLDAVFLSIPLLGLPLAATRVGLAFAVAVLAGVLTARLFVPRGPALELPDDAPGPVPALGARLRAALREGFVETVDSVGPWLLVGLLVAAVAEPLLSARPLEGLPDALEVGLFAVLGLPGYVCASAATPIAAVFIATGVSPGAALAFLITGPATNVTTFGVLAQLHGRRLALGFAAVVFCVTVALGIGVNALLPAGATEGAGVHEHGPSALQVAAGVGLALVLAASLIRRGPRRWLLELKGPGGRPIDPGGDAGCCATEGHDHDHDHDHHDHDRDHGHDHAAPTSGGGGCCGGTEGSW